MVKNVKLVTAPAQNVLNVTELKNFLRLDTTDDDLLVTSILKAATLRLEAYCNQKFVNQTWDIFYDKLPGEKCNQWWDGVRDGSISELNYTSGVLHLPFGPVSSLTGVFTYDDDDTEYEFGSSNYSVDTSGPYGRIGLKTGATWPATVLRPLNGVRVRGVFGMGAGYIASPETASTIPADIQEAVKQLSAIMYEHRGDELTKIPSHVTFLLAQYVRHRVF